MRVGFDGHPDSSVERQVTPNNPTKVKQLLNGYYKVLVLSTSYANFGAPTLRFPPLNMGQN